jgi:hypothetical protein
MYGLSNNPHYLQGGLFIHGLNMNELLLRRAHVLRDPTKLAIAIANYAFKYLFTTQTLHLEGEEVRLSQA